MGQAYVSIKSRKILLPVPMTEWPGAEKRLKICNSHTVRKERTRVICTAIVHINVTLKMPHEVFFRSYSQFTSHVTGTLKIERSFESYMSVLNIANEISEFA